MSFSSGARVKVIGVMQVNGVQIAEVRELNSDPFEQWGPRNKNSAEKESQYGLRIIRNKNLE